MAWQGKAGTAWQGRRGGVREMTNHVVDRVWFRVLEHAYGCMAGVVAREIYSRIFERVASRVFDRLDVRVRSCEIVSLLNKQAQ